MQPKISVIVPVYNVFQYLADCLNSVFSQDIDKNCYEVIVVDDCSPHGEKTIVDTYIEKYSNIRYIRHDVNKRQGGARNTGIRVARGEFLMFLDSDDILVYSNTLSVLMNLLEKYNPIVLRSEPYTSISSEIRYNQLNKYLKIDNIQQSLRSFKEWYMGKISCSTWGTLYKRTFILNNNLFFRENVMYEDTDWVHKVLFYAENINFIDIPYYGYRQTPNSTTRSYSLASFKDNVEGVIETYRFFETVKFDTSFRIFFNERYVRTVINLLKISLKYSVLNSYKVLRKLNKNKVTYLKSQSLFKNMILCLIRVTPITLIILAKVFSNISSFLGIKR